LPLQENAVIVFLELMRPLNCLMAGIAAIIGLLIAGGREIEAAILIFLAVFLVTGAGNAVNDYFDREIDAINRPQRPVPSGRITPQATLQWSLALFFMGCVLAGLVNSLCLAIAAVNSALLYIYARNLKATPLAGNLCVAYLTGSTFLFGGAAYGIPGMTFALIPFLLSFLATMSREIMKDAEDAEGDRIGGAKTLPILAGERLSSALAMLFSLAAIVLSFQPAFGNAYLAIIAIADLFLLAAVWKIIKKDASGSQRALKLGMAVALVAFLAKALFPSLSFNP
jgi:geranylgeranylglycerol-phosphate geranylgeranyltransferase